MSSNLGTVTGVKLDLLQVESNVVKNSKSGTASTSSANFDDLNSAAKHCFEYVKELHDHHQIQSNFTVHDRGRLIAKLKRGKRCDIINSVNKKLRFIFTLESYNFRGNFKSKIICSVFYNISPPNFAILVKDAAEF